MESLLGGVIDAIFGVIRFIASLFVAMFTALFDLIKDIFYWIFEIILQFIVALLSGIELGFISTLNYMSLLPPDLINIMALIGMGEALTIITGAITVRIILQLIPFVRLGS